MDTRGEAEVSAHADGGGPGRSVNLFRPLSLRQRVLLALTAVFAAGIATGVALISFGHDLLFRLWGSYTFPRGANYECFWQRGTRQCYSPFSFAVHVWAMVALAAAGSSSDRDESEVAESGDDQAKPKRPRKAKTA